MNHSRDGYMTEAAMRRLLGISAEADLKDIKAAFRRKIKLLHPDRSSCSSTRTIGRLIEAYSGLAALYRTGKPPADPPTSPSPERGSTPGCLTDVFALGELALSSSEAAVRIAAIQALAQSGRRSSFSYLRKLIHDPDQQVAAAAIRAAAALDIRQAGAELAAIYSRSSIGVREAILDSVELLGQLPGCSAIVNCALEDPVAALRQRALRLQRLQGESDIERMRRMA
ncbi:HEAT repeat domain-containing protein [Spirochaeta africana]|uniref:DnaJ-class molecular chaperone with C-terminal Zn finger domain n=1 Tax=Spirochaeta africana (strain ATCC 700263 / DSM 8902 / Z-7692) TaxID=889378 RepID=H9UKT1_SPIAZ|nr:HEAT repeat domain-containing protein [Spirochaeta africana]AFG38124.1 DnaJ-class molecular chaperone with C-terminal Zn finger domain [Spirochaeta africana DSM 8902]